MLDYIVTPSGFADVNYARPQQLPAEQSQSEEENQLLRYDVAKSSVVMTASPTPLSVLCSTLLLGLCLHAVA